MQIELDDIDRKLLHALQGNARLTTTELAQLTGLSQSPCWRRIKRLEDAGVIGGYHARLDRRALGYGVMAFVMIGIDHQNETRSAEFEAAVSAIPEVVMQHAISGPEDFMLGVVVRDLDAYSELLERKLHRLPGVRHIRTFFSLRSFRNLEDLPIPAPVE